MHELACMHVSYYRIHVSNRDKIRVKEDRCPSMLSQTVDLTRLTACATKGRSTDLHISWVGMYVQSRIQPCRTLQSSALSTP